LTKALLLLEVITLFVVREGWGGSYVKLHLLFFATC